MAVYRFSSWEINGQTYLEEELNIIMDTNINVVAHYVDVTADELLATVGDFQIYLSSAYSDYYVLNILSGVIEVRFPTFEACMEWVEASSGGSPLGSILILGAVAAWFSKG